MSRLRPSVPLGQVIKGKVTKVNTFILYFEVDEKFRVYIDLHKRPANLPHLHDDIEISHPKKFNSLTYTAVIGSDTIYKFSEKSHKCDTNAFLQFITVNNISTDVDEVIAIDLIVRRLESFVTIDAVHLCLIVLYEHGLSHNSNLGNPEDSKNSFKKALVRVPKDLQYANCDSQLYKFLNFDGPYMFNVYPNKTIEKVTDCVSEYLFGILTVAGSHGYFILRDDTSEIIVKFIGHFDDLYRLHNCLVLIKKYTVFNEIYQERRWPTLHYVLLNMQDVVVVKSSIDKERRKLYYGRNELSIPDFKHCYFLQIRRISEVIYGYNDSPECWIEALISPRGEFFQSEFIYAIVPEGLIEIKPFLKEHIVYKISANERLKQGNIGTYRELFGMKEIKKVYHLIPDMVFQETTLPGIEMTSIILDDFQEIKSHIANTFDYKMFSLVLTIERKEFQRVTYASWFPRRHKNNRHFGGIENHQQRLIFWDSLSKSFIDLYLANRENHVIPLGLISKMKVRIKHVQVNKRRYLKATVFTSFEIVDYCPEIRFSSVNLRFPNRSTWQWRTKTPPTLLGMYAHIPSNCVVHGTVLFRAVLDLRLCTVCVKCRRVLLEERCLRCQVEGKDIDFFMVVNAQDSINPTFNMEIDNIYFLLDLLGISNGKGEDAFFEECLQGRTLEIDFLKISEEHLLNDADANPVFQKMVTMIRSQINYKFYFMMDVVCIRQVGEGRKPWRLVQHRFLT